MRYYLSSPCCLKLLEGPCVYHIKKDELYELDEDAYHYLELAARSRGAKPPDDTDFLQFCLDEDILTDMPVARVRPVPRQSPVPSLRYLEFQITNKCILRCRHCYVGAAERCELSLQEVQKVFDEFQALQGLRLLMTGGEPLLHSRFDEINAILPRYSFRKVLFTNGLLISENLLERLHIDELQVSIDGMRQGHEALRGTGTYRRAIGAVRLALDKGVPVSVATMIHRSNLDEFEAMDALFKDLGIVDWTVDVPSLTGNMLAHRLLYVPPEVAGYYLQYGFGGGVHGGGKGYACGLHLASVLANGTVCKCAFYADAPVGSIRDGLAACWKKIRPVPLSDLSCSAKNCPVLDECRGGCRYRAGLCGAESMSEEEKKIAPDLYKCYSYGIIESERQA